MKHSIRGIGVLSVLLGSLSCGGPESDASEREYEGKETMKEVGVSSIAYEHIFTDDRPFAQCHASTMIPLGEEKYLVAWFAGSHEKHDDVGIWTAKGKPGNWSEPQLLVKVRNDPHWNPVLFNAPDGKVYLYFKVGKEIDFWETWVQVSEDGGETWSEARELVPGDKGGRGPVRNHMLVLSDGTWLAPSSDEKNKVWTVFVDRSEDGGKTWEASDKLDMDRSEITGEGVIQPALWESKPGHVHMLMRSSSGNICRADSEDYGKTWSKITETSLPNNNSGIDVAHLGGEKIAVIYNPVSENWGARYPISVAVSLDNGHSWSQTFDIEKGVGEEDELSYPAMFYEDGHLVACYTWNRQRVAFWKGKLEGI
ncbi:sialidase family protein [Cyclobacterium xiamenense]|uniref:sialidase family protein n=1 Tax=Cyclobacterium xiamenense TaxID=1297121 RepID=UPI0012B81B20|nr:sialidase family protein [Cyclobacterium xiamenense]